MLEEQVQLAEPAGKQFEEDAIFRLLEERIDENTPDIFKFLSHRTDVGNAERFAYYAKQEHWRFCHPWNRWLYFDSTRWTFDNSGAVKKFAKLVLRQLQGLASMDKDDRRRRELIEFLLRSESNSRIRAMLELAQSELPIAPETFDQDPFLLNVANGTLDLRTGALRKHSPEDYITKIIPVKYDEEAQSPLWLEFLDQVLGGDDFLKVFIQQAIGYSLTGSCREQCLFLCFGTGSNGKSVFIQTVAALLGDYGLRTPTDTLMLKRNDNIPNDIARLAGSRFVYATESDENRRLAESLVKSMTGQDTLSARFLHAEFFDFAPEFKLWLSTNHKPQIKGADEAMWRRIRLIPFTVYIPPDKQDKELTAKLRTELSGILNWALQGCTDWLRNGLFVPPAVTEATKEYRTAMDSLHDFLEDCCVLGAGETQSSALYSAYKEWATDNGEKVMSQRSFSMRLEEQDFRKVAKQGVRVFKGIELREK